MKKSITVAFDAMTGRFKNGKSGLAEKGLEFIKLWKMMIK
ncbi:MAG: Unknown protein [uncultured Thiotrichaceae bacterium]|uniref:Uncharacterized protein n=1 Tax=uncultured Thiotrichaceae bacterium TaxID=298394 RepID=A0A6S6SMY2_9GAMM|nr:MAG: Unknown protein [uncultured Thiotrichaceae bacterium]